jgi:AraC-like DNA-binding protein
MTLKPETKISLRRSIVLLLPLLFCVPAIIGYVKKDRVIFPGITAGQLTPYSDSSASEGGSGKSYVKDLSIDKGGIRFTFHRVSGTKYPYAGFRISRPAGSHFINASSFKYLVLSISSEDSKGVQVTLHTFLAGVTKPDSEDTYCPNMRDIYFLPGTNTYRIGLESFNTESWWYSQNNMTKKTVGEIDFSRIIDIQFESEDIAPGDMDETIRINSISFEKDNALLYTATFLIVLFYYLGLWLYRRMLAKMRTPLAIPYEKLNMINYNDEYLRKIVDCIAKEYTDRSLTITKVSEKTGISPSKISQVIQLSFNLSFKQYVNTIRLAEAQRLFRETDRQISEIAFNVGYQNLTHFYRVFKQVYNIAPNEFRKKFQEQNK